MELTLRHSITAGVAALSAGTIALAPVTPPAAPEVHLPAVQLTGIFNGVITDIYDINGSLAAVSPLLGGYTTPPDLLPVPAWLPVPPGLQFVGVLGYFTVGADLVTSPLALADRWLDVTAPAVAHALQQVITDLANPAAELAHIGTALSNVGNELFGSALNLVVDTVRVAAQEAALLTLALDGNPLDALTAIGLMPTPLLELPLEIAYTVVNDVVNDLPYAIASAF